MAKTGEGAESTGSDEAGYVDGDSGEVGEIDGISGATVTSNAIIKLVNNAYDFISDYAK